MKTARTINDFIGETTDKINEANNNEKLKNYNDFVQSLNLEYSKKSQKSQVSASELYLNF